MTEYRLVVARPDAQQGRGQFYYPKRDEAAALKGLENHRLEQKRRVAEPWDAWVESRTVTEWTAVELLETPA